MWWLISIAIIVYASGTYVMVKIAKESDERGREMYNTYNNKKK
ncbi:hypothetical protein [Clostridium sp.]|nr:hypothetical protein [Clostridium sp.]